MPITTTIEPDKIDRYRLPRGYVRVEDEEVFVLFTKDEYRDLLRMDADLKVADQNIERLIPENTNLRRHAEGLQRELNETSDDLKYYRTEREKLHNNLVAANAELASCKEDIQDANTIIAELSVPREVSTPLASVSNKKKNVKFWIASALALLFFVSTVALGIALVV